MSILSIGESRPKEFKVFSRATELFEFDRKDAGKHSHIFISWKDHLGLRWVAEARGTGVRMLSNVEFKRDNEIVNIYHYDATSAGINAMIEYIWANLAKKYGYKQIYGLAEMRVLNKLYRELGRENSAVNRFADGESSQICVEFALRCLEAASGGKVNALCLEQWGLIEMRKFNLRNGRKLPSIRIDQINGVIK